jgi:uncharacterized protein (TIGR03545 family)
MAPVKTAAVSQVTTIKTNASTEIEASKLEGLKKLDEAKLKLSEIEHRWKSKQSEGLAIAKEAETLASELKSLGQGGSSAGDILKKAQQAQQAQKKIKELIARVEAQRAQAKSDLNEIQAVIKQADDLRHKDINGLLAAAGLPTLDSQDLARRLLGAQTSARLSTTLHWMKWAREKAAARKTASAAPTRASSRLRRRGLDIEFPKTHSYPKFLLENAKLSGQLDAAFMGHDLTLAGVLNGVTSNPALYGKPATLTLSGQAASGEHIQLNARIHQQKDPMGIALAANGEGFSLAGASLGDGEIGALIKDGHATLKAQIDSAGDEWKGEILLQASGLVMEPRVSISGIAGTALGDGLRAINSFSMRIGLSGQENDMRLTFSSNIADTLSAAMKKAFAGQLEAQRKIVQSKIDALYNDKLKGVRSQVDSATSGIMGPLDQQKSALDRQLQDVLKKSIGGNKLPPLNKLLKF